MSVNTAFTPVHCPDEADDRRSLGVDFGTDCKVAHAVVDGASEGAAAWLREVCACLETATLIGLEVPHPEPPQRVIRRRELDPTTAHVVVELARWGSLEAPYLYVGLVAQHSDSVWHGIAGTFLPLCPHCREDQSMARVQARAHALMPPGASLLAADARPPGLEPQDGWLEHRAICMIRLPQSEAQPWAVMDGDAGPDLPDDPKALLVHTGARLTAEPNLVYLADRGDLPPFLNVLFDGAGPVTRLVSVRRGPPRVLRRIGAEGGAAPTPPRCLTPRTLRSRMPPGWSILHWSQVGGTAEAMLTRTPTSLFRSLQASGRVSAGCSAEVWIAPRLSPEGAIDGTQLLALQQRLQGRPEPGVDPSW